MKNVAIIGGGILGLTSAYYLSQKGHKVTVFEKDSKLGGLLKATKIAGEYIEQAYHHVFRGDDEFLELLQELGLRDRLVWLTSSSSLYTERKFYPFNNPFDLLKFSPLSFLDRIRTGLTLFKLKNTKNWKKFEKVTAATWLEKNVSQKIFETIFLPLLKGKFDDHWNEISMAWLWARFFERSNSRSNIFQNESLGYLRGGFYQVINRLEKAIKQRGGKIFKDANVQSIPSTLLGAGRDTEIQISNNIEITTNSSSYRFDKIFSTVPSPVFANMISKNSQVSNSYIKKLKSIEYLGCITLLFTSNQDLSPFYWNTINDEKYPFVVFINHTKLVDRRYYNGKNIYYLGAYLPQNSRFFRMSDRKIRESWFKNLKRLVSNFDMKKVEESKIFRFKCAQHVVDTRYEIPDIKTPLKNVYLTNYSQIYPFDRGVNRAVKQVRKLVSYLAY
jgi:protoporphyrinogen oxidase